MTAVYNPETKRMEQVANNGNSENGNKEHTVYYHLTGEGLETLTGFAKEDGFDMNGDSDTGRKAKIGKAVKQYIDVAITEFIAMRRSALAQEPTAEEPARKGKKPPKSTEEVES